MQGEKYIAGNMLGEKQVSFARKVAHVVTNERQVCR